MAQFKRVWSPYKTNFTNLNEMGLLGINYHPIDGETTEKSNTKIQNLITQGWRIVSTAPITGSVNMLKPKEVVGLDLYFTYTTGIEVFMVKE